MSPGQYETIAVEPLRVPGIMLQKLRPKSVSHSGSAHRHARMAGVRVLDSVHRQHSDRVDPQVLQLSIQFLIHISLRNVQKQSRDHLDRAVFSVSWMYSPLTGVD